MGEAFWIGGGLLWFVGLCVLNWHNRKLEGRTSKQLEETKFLLQSARHEREETERLVAMMLSATEKRSTTK